jgi:hypothetical protein
MKHLVNSLSAVVLLVLAGSCSIAGQKKGDEQVIAQDVMNLFARLDTLDEQSRMKLLSTVDQQRNELLGLLLKQLGTSRSANVRAAAIYLIGRHRLSDGVDELIRWIDFAPGSEQRIPEPEPLWEKYPAMEALIVIGKPSVKPAVELIATDANDLRRTLAVKVIRYVEGGNVASMVLEQAFSSELDPSRKSMLADGRVRMEKLVKETQ